MEPLVRHESEQPAGVHLSLRDAVRFKRNDCGWSQRELAKMAGLSPAYVSALETGRIHPSLRAFARLARVLRFTGPELGLIMHSEALADEEDS